MQEDKCFIIEIQISLHKKWPLRKMSHMNFSDAFETVSALEKRKKNECILYIFAIFVKDLGKVKMLGLKYSIFAL